MMAGTKFDIGKFNGMNDFGLWQVIGSYGRLPRRRLQRGLEETLYMTKSLANRLYLKKLYTFHIHLGKSQSEYIDEFHKLVGDLAAIDTAISDKDQAFLLLTSLSSSYDNLMETLLYGHDTLKLEDRDMEQGTYSAWSKSQGRSSRLGCYIFQSEEHLKRDCPRYNHKKSQGCVRIEDHVSGSGADGYESVDVMMAMKYDDGNILLGGDGRECRVRETGQVSCWTTSEGFSVKMQLGKIKVIKGSLVVLSETRRANCVYTLDGQAVTRKTLKGGKSTQQCTKSGVAKHLGVEGLQQQNGLVEETNVTLLAKVRYFLIQSAIGFKTSIDMLGLFGWLASKRQGMLEPVKVKCIFMGYRKGIVGNKALEVEPQEDHTFEVEPHGNVDHVAGSQEVQTQGLIYYHLARDREQHSTRELFNYREDSNEAAFAVAEAEKIYAHESLTFNNTVSCEVISKWKAGLKDDMDARSDVYALSNGYRKCSDDSDVYYWEYTPGMFIHLFLYIDGMVFSFGCKTEIWVTKGLLVKAKGNVLGMEIVRDQSGNTLRVSQSRFYNEKLVHTLLEGHSILSLEGSLSRDCDVEKNGKWSCIYVVGSQEYQMVCTRLDIASTDVGMLDKFDHGLQTDVQVFVDFDYAMAAYMTLTEAAKEAIWLKGLAIESGFELKIVTSIATCALNKGGPRIKVTARVEAAAYQRFLI
ncbi:hypothetical protein Tco_0729869 [Tanacetum coccineum]|uniref:Zinc finger, CCHC-type n=1 Tax=Tanacetum coccineum TaxID=301880 RepID=A0ABQ4YTQ5_9ASTR